MTSCSAPHDNPLDSSSPYYVVQQPPAAITNLAIDSLSELRCSITWSAPQGAATYRLYSALNDWDGSNPDGVDLYPGELPGPKSPGTQQAVWINLPAGQTRDWALFSESASGLRSSASNILGITAYDPGVVDASVVSIHIAQWSGLDRYELEITVTIMDADTVDLVLVELDEELFGLSPLEDGLTWHKRFSEGVLPSSNIESLVGHTISLSYFDRAGFRQSDSSMSLVRVIRTEPEWISPSPNDTLDLLTPRFEWLPYEAEFTFSYGLEIHHVPESAPEAPVLVYSRRGIHSDSTGHSVEVELPSDPLFLYWILFIEDEFGNRSVSLESNFQVKSND